MAHAFGGKLNGETLAVLKFFEENNLIDKNRLTALIDAETKKVSDTSALKQENERLRAEIAKLKAATPTVTTAKPALSKMEKLVLSVVASKTTVSRSQVVTRLGLNGEALPTWNYVRKGLLARGLIEQVDFRRRFATYRVTVAGRALLD